MRKLIPLFFSLAVVACTTQMYVPADQNVNKRQAATLAELQSGREVYTNHCGKCHKIPKPQAFNEQQWTKVLEKMAPKAKLTKEQTDLVYKYVVNY